MPAVNLIPNRRNFLLVKLKIKKQEHLFLIDTGAQGTMLVSELLKGYQPYREGTLGGVGGGEDSYSVLITLNLMHKTLHEVTKAPSMFERFVQEVAEENGFRLSGIIGQDLLGQLSHYTVDNKNQRFIFTP